MLRALPYIVPLALALYALIDLSRSRPVERADLHPAAWVAIIVLLPVIGPVAWIVVSRGRRRADGTPVPGARPTRPGPTGGGRPVRRRGPVAPDDDPDFLWRIEQEQRRRRRSAGTDGDPTPEAAPDPARETAPDPDPDPEP